MKILAWFLSFGMLIALGVGLVGLYTLKTSRYPILSLDPQITAVQGSFDSQSEGKGPAGVAATFFRVTEYRQARFFILGAGYQMPLETGDRLELAISKQDAVSLSGLAVNKDILAVGLTVNGQTIVDVNQTIAKARLLTRKAKLLFSVLIDGSLVYFIFLACRALWKRQR